MRRQVVLLFAIVAMASSWVVAQSRDRGETPPPANTGTGIVAGVVSMAGTGQPVEGARVTLNGVELRGSRTALTNDDGQFVFVDLPAGTFTVRATLTGHISGTFGQKEPGKPGTSIVLAAGQQLKNASFTIAKGGVISGSVFDEKGRPSIGTPVRVMRWILQSGERMLTTAGNGATDDRGMYRVFNLTPGDYLVSAVPRNTAAEVFTSADLVNQARLSELSALGLATPAAPISVTLDSSGRVTATSSNDPVQGYAPVFYPGTTQLGAAQTVRVGIAAEQLGIDFGLQRVALTTVSGQVIVPNGQSPTTVQVRLMSPEGGAVGLGQQTARPAQNGTFSFRSVVPGQYNLLATANVAEARAPTASPTAERIEMLNREIQMMQSGGQPAQQRRIWAQGDVFVDGAVPPVVTLTMQEGISVSGQIVFDGTAPLPNANQRVRVSINPLGTALQSMGVGSVSAMVDAGNRFTLAGIIPGRYRISASGAQGWNVKSAMVGGIDVLDFPFDIASGEAAPNVTIHFGDRNTDLKGVLSDASGAPAPDFSVVIFPDDQRYWVPFARRMRSTRPASDGKFAFVGLPPGDYRIAAVTDVETGEWLDPEFLRQLLPASISVRLADGQQVTQDIRVR
jgi:uncharacterized protein (DUF2141 family)